MIEPSKHQPDPRMRKKDALDVGDFVYAATGARVRRLTMPDGTHWFPAVDVCKQLGYTTPPKGTPRSRAGRTSRVSRDTDWKSRSRHSRR